MESDEISFGQSTLELDPLPGILVRHALEVRDEGFFAIRDVRVVLRVRLPGVAFDRLGRPRLVEHEVVERLRVLLVALQAIAHPIGS